MYTILENTDAVKYVQEFPHRRSLLHVVNCKGVMGSGIAKQVRDEVPSAYNNYIIDSKRGALYLGTLSWADDYSVINLAAQDKYGYDGERYLNYAALAQCLYRLHIHFSHVIDGNEIVVPYLMGCDRAGGDWEIVLEMLEFYMKKHFIICKLGG